MQTATGGAHRHCRQRDCGGYRPWTAGVAGGRGSIALAITLITNTLAASALDEVSTEYGLLAEGARHPPDFSWVTYRLRAEAKWHDGRPVTPEDVIFSLESLKTHHPQ